MSLNINKNNINSEIEKILNEAIDDGAFPGATYAFITKDHVYSGVVGNRELFPKIIKNDINTIYDMASLTKVVATTTSVMQLLEDGKIRLFDPVQYYLPRFKYPKITLWHLLVHTSGLPEGIGGPKDELSEEDVWNKIYETEQRFNEGSKIMYSDINFILLGKIVELVSGEKLNDYVVNHIFKPLKMFDTSYLPKDKERCAATELRNDKSYNGYVKGYVHDETSFALGGVAGHAGLFSTALDVSRFIKMILNEGELDNERILSKETVRMLYKTQIAEFDSIGNIPVRARKLGWQAHETYSNAGDYISDESIMHTGFTGTNIWIDKKRNLGFVLLTNRVHPTRNNTKHMRVRARLANMILANWSE